ncbi:hypothetical protein V6C27_05575 [Peptococcaceae bacterium 1198_IL3148]
MVCKEKELPIIDIEDSDEKTTAEFESESLEDQEEEFDYRNYPHLDIF